VQLALPTAGLLAYKSPSQRARIATEAWAAAHLYCANCASPKIECLPRNTPVHDFSCPACRAPYQLKSQSKPLRGRIVDAEHAQMCRAIREDRTPNLLVMHYDLANWRVRTLILIPRFAFSLAAIERRRPLGPQARRAGWIGCNILLDSIPADARLMLIENGKLIDPAAVRRKYKRVKPLAAIEPSERGWTLDVLAAVRSLGKQSFTLSEVYALEPSLAKLHPGNRHVPDKIRQQLQVLRDARLLDFVDRGTYRLRS
jgi:type II restriction enzyme